MEDHSVDDDNSSILSSSPANSPVMDRNPSPPPDREGEQDGEKVDAIGDTVYSKHWLFSTLTRLIQIVSEQNTGDSDGQMQLPEEDEDELCKIWDMAMDKDVAGFLQEFKAADILLGVIAKSRCPRLTEICVGILGNIACFPDTCLTLSQNNDLGVVLLLLLGDTDPPTLLETSRLLLTCVSQSDVSSLWLERVRQQTSVCSSLCFIMCSSTNMDLLVKVGELVDKLFDLDEELMKTWVTAGSQPSDEDKEEGERRLDVASSLLEAAKQLRSESPEGLEVYLHALQLLTTIHHGIQTLAVAGGTGQALWTFLCEVVCEDLCQPDDPPLVLQEQKSLLVHALAVLSVLYACQDQEAEHSKADTLLPLVGSMLRVLQYHREYQVSSGHKEKKDGQEKEEEEEKVDEQLQALIQTTAEFLSDIITDLTKDAVSELVARGYLTEKTCLSAVGSMLPQFSPAVQRLVFMLSEADPQLADTVTKEFPVSLGPSWSTSPPLPSPD
ncbi:protein saal1 isoform X1 [Salmo trutta]|uniref:Serum amyloid A-like 1 n=1 Tax=Salmo trutta TaxID=8032 RepID=A0A673ZJN2_SALTR|nr:protein SAAL1 isoform X1 [Salmo trutta]